MTFSLKSLVLASLLVVALPLGAAAAAAPSTKASPLLGIWQLDTSRMPVPAAQRPNSVRFTFADAGSNKLAVNVDIVYAPGQEVHSTGTGAFDGTPTQVKDSPEADTGSFKQPAPNVLVMALVKQGVLVSTRIYTVLPDGRTLVETAVYPGKDGVPVMRENYFTRVR